MAHNIAKNAVEHTSAAPASASQGGCTDCSAPDAVTAAQAEGAIIAPQAERTRVPSSDCGDCNEDARCGKCAGCMDGK